MWLFHTNCGTVTKFNNSRNEISEKNSWIHLDRWTNKTNTEIAKELNIT
jgi:hypothetical protein